MTGRIPGRARSWLRDPPGDCSLGGLCRGGECQGALRQHPKDAARQLRLDRLRGNFHVRARGEVELTKASAKHAENLTVSAVMSSWACQSGGWSTDNCVTTPGAKFSQPITLKLYGVGALGEPAGPIAQTTQTFEIPTDPRPARSARANSREPGGRRRAKAST